VVSILLKNISQLGSLFPIHGKVKHVPNHQPEMVDYAMKPSVTTTETTIKSIFP
jgi:hypothetical protein